MVRPVTPRLIVWSTNLLVPGLLRLLARYTAAVRWPQLSILNGADPGAASTFTAHGWPRTPLT
eukprot:8246781-Pyramimonas_sp.AAC.1